MEEIWRDVAGYEGKYQVSNQGRVRSLDSTGGHRFGKAIKKGQLRVGQISKNGYVFISFSTKDKIKTFSVHRLVASAFVQGKTDLKNEVNHKDGNKLNNFSENLEWVSRKENQNHAVKNGLIKSGQHHRLSVLTDRDIQHIKDEYCRLGFKRGSVTKIAKGYGVSKSRICTILKHDQR